MPTPQIMSGRPLRPSSPISLSIASIDNWSISKSPSFWLENLSLRTIHNTVSCLPTMANSTVHLEKMPTMDIQPRLEATLVPLDFVPPPRAPCQSHVSDLVTCAAVLRSVGEWGAPEAQHGPLVDEPALSVLFSEYGRAYLTPPQRAGFKVPCGNRDRDLAC